MFVFFVHKVSKVLQLGTLYNLSAKLCSGISHQRTQYNLSQVLVQTFPLDTAKTRMILLDNNIPKKMKTATMVIFHQVLEKKGSTFLETTRAC